MIKFGGVRPTGKIKHLKLKNKTRKLISKSSNKKTAVRKNIFRMLNSTRHMNKIKNVFEKSENSEEQVLKTSKKFVKLFDKLLNDSKYVKIRSSVEIKLEVLETTEGAIIERHKIKNEELKEKLEDEVIEDDVIETYRDVIKEAREIYNDDDDELREAASVFLSIITDELYNAFFSKKNSVEKMNINMNVNNSGLTDLLSSLKI